MGSGDDDDDRPLRKMRPTDTLTALVFVFCV